MPLIIRESGVAVHIYPVDDPKICHCFDSDIDSGIEIEVDLDSRLVTGYGPTSKVPLGDFLIDALQVVRKHHETLLRAWDEIHG